MVAQDHNQASSPVIAVQPRRLRRCIAQRVDHWHKPAPTGPPSASQHWIADDSSRAAEAGEVPRFGRRHQRDCLPCGRMVEARKRNVPHTIIEQEVRPYLVAHHGEPMPLGKVGQLQKFVAAKHGARWIVRMAEPEDF